MPDIARDYRLPESLQGTILEKILQARVYEILGAKQKLPAILMESVLDKAAEIRSFRKALLSKSPAVIAEIKRASPSAGLIRRDFDFVGIAQEYRGAGAAALSVVTEVRHFLGGLEVLASLRWNNSLPLLRKDFIIDRYQIVEARHAGADAVLLIAALLDIATLKNFREEAEKLGMEALVEVHNESELDLALESGATLIGVNNRDLRTFEVSLDVSMNLARKMPQQVLPVAESGIRNAGDLRRLLDAGYRGCLVGEQLMRAPSPGAALKELLRER
jgi:indole-3-glycerol phosphate synthase